MDYMRKRVGWGGSMAIEEEDEVGNNKNDMGWYILFGFN